jgi:hypothetical protein
MKPGRVFPPTIPLASGQIFTSEKGFEAVGKLAALYRHEPARLKARVSRDIYDKAVLYALGDSIADFRNQPTFDNENWPGPLTALFKIKLEARLSGATQDRAQIVPCHIFHYDQVAAAFEIGPVTFYPRHEWLKTLNVDAVRTDLIEDVWFDRLAVGDLQKKTFGPNTNLPIRGAYAAVMTIGAHRWVGVATVTNYDPIQSSKKGTTLVSLALDFFCLLYNPADGAGITYAGGGRLPIGERNLFADDRGELFDSMKVNLPGIGGRPGAAQAVLNESLALRQSAGAVLTRYNSETSEGKVSRLIDRWINALHWYGQALREPSDFMAIVKYGCAMDILTGAGGNLTKMVECIAAAFGCETDVVVDGRSLGDDVNRVFNEGRSALAHGTHFGLLAENRDERALANSPVRQLLLAFTEPLAEVVGENNRMLELEDQEMRAFIERLKVWANKQRAEKSPL